MSETNKYPFRDDEGQAMVSPRSGDAAVAVYLAWQSLITSTTVIGQAEAHVRLSNAMTDLVTWLPGYDVKTGRLEVPE